MTTRKVPVPVAVRRLGNNFEVTYSTGYRVMMPALRLTDVMLALLAKDDAIVAEVAASRAEWNALPRDEKIRRTAVDMTGEATYARIVK
jgi:hypothetical protein